MTERADEILEEIRSGWGDAEINISDIAESTGLTYNQIRHMAKKGGLGKKAKNMPHSASAYLTPKPLMSEAEISKLFERRTA